MTMYNCPRCGRPSTAERCGSCGRGPEPLLSRLTELDAVLQVMPANLQSRASVEAERLEVLDDLTRRAAGYLAEAEQAAAATPPPHTPMGGLLQNPQQSPRTPASGAPAAPQWAVDTPATQPNLAPPPPAPQVPPPYQQQPLTQPPYQPRERGEVAAKTVQTTLLSLGGLLVAAAIIIFTAVAWRNLGDEGRAVILGGFTGLLLLIPLGLQRLRLWSTAETFASLASLALWCSALAGYYLYLPAGATFGPEAVGAWTAAVLAALAAYRGAARLTATGWALLPLAAVGLAFSAAGDLGQAVTLMLTIAAALGAAAWIVVRRPTRATRSDLWVSRLLTCAAVVAACSAGLRAAFGLDDPIAAPVAAAVALLAAANLLAVQVAKRLGASITTMLVAASAAGSLVLCAWVLAARATAPELIIPSLALLAAGLAALITPLEPRPDQERLPFAGACLAGLAALAAFATVTFDAPDLSSYLVAFIAARLVSTLLAEPVRTALRQASYVVGIGTAAAASLIALGGFGVYWWDGEPSGLFTIEVPIVLAALAFAAVLVPPRHRIDAVALALTFAVLSASVLLWHSGPDRYDLIPFLGFIVCGLIALAGTLASDTLAGRCTSWVALALWAPITAVAAGISDTLDPGEGQIEFALAVVAAAMLVFAVGAPRRSRPDRVLGAILAHVLAGSTIVWTFAFNWLGWTIEASEANLVLPAQFGVYTLALVGAALMAPVVKRAYSIAALCTGTAGWWSLLASQGVETLEYFTGPPAAVLFIMGLWRLERRPETGSWAALALPIIGGLAPSLILALGDGDALRRIGVGAAAIAVILAGLFRRWQAPLVLGSIILGVLTINEVALLWDRIPKWIPLALGGAILIGAGATFEKRRRDVARIRDSLRSMR